MDRRTQHDFKIMADTVNKEVALRQLENALGEQFYLLVQGAKFRINLARRYGLDSAAFTNYNAKYVPLVNAWWKKEVGYETLNEKVKGTKGIIFGGDLMLNDFYYSASLPKLDQVLAKYNADKVVKGIGWIMLAVWAIVAIAALVTAAKIVDDLTTTAQEKEALMKTTQDTCKNLNLSPDQCANLINNTQEQASDTSGGIGTTLKWGAIIVGGFFILKETGILKPKAA